MLTQLLFSLGILAVVLLFIHFTLVRPMKRFLVDEVVSSLTAIRDSIDRNTAATQGAYPGVQSINGKTGHSLDKGV